MKILFLDIDVVLNNEYTTDACGHYIGIEDVKVELLKQIIDSTDAKIVLSSSWRLGMDNKGHRLENHIPYLTNKLAKCRLEIYDKTDQLPDDSRGAEINKWLQEHSDIDAWVVLDDEWFWDYNQYDIRKHLVRTWFYSKDGGLQEEDVQKAIKILNNEFEEEEDDDTE